MSGVRRQVSRASSPLRRIGPICLIALLAGSSFSADYPQWRGADGSGATLDSGVELIEDMSKAKVVWKSEDIPNVYNFQMKSQDVEGGYTSPSLVDGRIYMQWYYPAGEAISEIRKKAYPDYPPETWKVYADDVFICFDAKTGKTLWKREFKEKGTYMWGLCGLMHTQPAVHNGKVHGVGSLSRVYCMDVKTGAVVWESSLGAAHEWAVARVKEFLAAQADPSFDSDPKSKGKNPWNRNGRAQNVLGVGADGSLFSVLMPQLGIDAAGGGVLVCNDGCVKSTGRGGSDGLVALDLKTGKQRWYNPGVVNHRQSPTVWYSNGHPYVLYNSRSDLKCADALTGKVMWTEKGAACTMDSGPVVSGPYIVVQGSARKKGSAFQGQNVSCYKADVKGATKLWTVDPEAFCLTGDKKGWMQPVIYRDHLYCATQFGHKHAGYGCIEMATGKVKGVVDGGDGVGGYCAILAADGRLVAESDVLDADPDNFRLLVKGGKFKAGQDWKKLHGDALSVVGNGVIAKPSGSSVKTSIPTARMFQSNLFANGFYYWRGPHNLWCIDLRKK